MARIQTEANVPTYQYACTACGHQLEAVQSFTDAPLTECPSCDGRLRKLFSAVGIVFKGSGFYRTDARNDSRSTVSGPRKRDTAKPEAASVDASRSASGKKELASVGSAGSPATASGSSSSGSASGSGSSGGGASAANP